MVGCGSISLLLLIVCHPDMIIDVTTLFYVKAIIVRIIVPYLSHSFLSNNYFHQNFYFYIFFRSFRISVGLL